MIELGWTSPAGLGAFLAGIGILFWGLQNGKQSCECKGKKKKG